MRNRGRILVVDDDKDILLTTRVVLKHSFEEILILQDPEKIPLIIQEKDPDVILLDMNFSQGANNGAEGVHWLKYIRENHPEIMVVMITAYGEVDLAVKAMKEGAFDFVMKPWENEKLLATVQASLKLSASQKEIIGLKTKQKVLEKNLDEPFKEIIGRSESMLEIFETIEKVGKTDANILILGENGTGKELVARAIHRNSDRNENVFINVDLGAIPESLFEAELFGVMKGSFTDAHEDKAGRFESAEGGTLFLDEIGNLSPQLQSKLLTAIQRKEISRIGSARTVPVDIRLICATNMPLHEMVKVSGFRQDLLYRINTVEIILPPMRERKEDIPELLDHFMKMYNKKYRKKCRMSQDAIKKLIAYDYPGNIRELQHIIERAVIMNDTGSIKGNDISVSDNQMEGNIKRILNIEELEKNAIKEALKKNNGNLSKAAKELGLGRTTLYRKMEKYSL